jgi:phosphohistidine phosphatase SixA
MSQILIPLFTALLLSACGQNGETSAFSNRSQAESPADQKSKTLAIGLTSKPSIEKSALLASIKDGGYVIYFRHATTKRDYADQADPLMKLDDCSSQRKLSTQGIEESYAIGMAFASKEIPVGEIIVSEYCRSWKTANLAFGEWTQKDSRLNFLPYTNYTEDHIELMKKNVMPLLTRPPMSGTNTVIIGHDDTFEAVTGIYPEPQGIAYILQPDGGGGFKIIASVLPSEWATL